MPRHGSIYIGPQFESITEQGAIAPVSGEDSRLDEPGHAALAIGEYYRATTESTLGGYDLLISPRAL